MSIASNDSDGPPTSSPLTGNGGGFPEISVFTGAGTAVGDELADNVGTESGLEAVPVGGIGSSQNLTLRNSRPVLISPICPPWWEAPIPGTSWWGLWGATTLAPNASTAFTVTFVPTAGSVRRAVSIASNDGDENRSRFSSGEGLWLRKLRCSQDWERQRATSV